MVTVLGRRFRVNFALKAISTSTGQTTLNVLAAVIMQKGLAAKRRVVQDYIDFDTHHPVVEPPHFAISTRTQSFLPKSKGETLEKV